MHQTEFIALMAMLFATVAFSIDSMLPALPEIAAELSPANPNQAQLILTSFVLGMGVGTLFAGPLSDAFGRRRVIVLGAALYCAASVAAYLAPTLETVLLARVVQGLGAAGPRIASMALVRDLYSGRQMARVVSFAMMIFTLVPAVAPLMGSWIMAGFGWRSIFLAFVVFSVVSMIWFLIRQPETLPASLRRPLRVRALWQAMTEVLSHRVIVLSIAVQTLVFGALFGTLSAAQQVFDETFGRGPSFPFWFAVIALVSGTASLLNASVVVRFGMWRLITVTLAGQIAVSAGLALIAVTGVLSPDLAFAAFVFWTTGVFFMAGLTLGNLNAMAMEPVGHIAGMAASVVGGIATVASLVVAVPLGLAFDGTVVPLTVGVGLASAVALVLMQLIPAR